MTTRIADDYAAIRIELERIEREKASVRGFVSMKYVKDYSAECDEVFQMMIDEETINRWTNKSSFIEISDVPFEGIPMRSRLRSEANEQRRLEAGVRAIQVPKAWPMYAASDQDCAQYIPQDYDPA